MITRLHHTCSIPFLIAAALLLSIRATGTAQGDDDDDDRKPTATIIGSGEVCEGDFTPAFIYFTGFGPWSAGINDNNGEYTTLSRVESPHTLWLKPVEDNIYYVDWVRDRFGRSGKTYGADTVIVKKRTPVEIILERSVYRVYEQGVTLKGDPPGGVFAGKGVSSGRFYPGIAGTEGSPHLVTYSYNADNGCISRDSVWIDVIHGRGSVYLVHDGDTVDAICNNEHAYLLAGSNPDGIPGHFELRVAGTGQVIPGHITDEDPGDDLADFDPGGLEGVYDIAYQYTFKELPVTTIRQVAISSLASLEISGIPDLVCKNGTPFRLEPELEGYDPGAAFAFAGNGITGSQQSGFYFHPSDTAVQAGNNTVQLDYRSSLGCRAIIDQDIIVRFVPGVEFHPASVCIPVEGGNVAFINLTAGKDSVETWSWNFGDIGSGANNFSEQEEPEHFYTEPGPRRIKLQATTRLGCASEYVVDTLLLNDPEADFTWISDCYLEDEGTSFISRSTTAFGSMDSLVWTFSGPDGEQVGQTSKGAGDDTVRFLFPALSQYQVHLEAYNSGGCSDEISRDIELFQTVRIPEEGYREDFNDPEVHWTARSVDENMSWVHGIPDFEGFVPGAGDLAWYTDLPYGVTGYTENSWIQSHCFDLEAVNRPFIELDLMKSFAPSISGAVLQYQDVVGEGWKTVGGVGEGVGWYNTSTIVTNPGGSSYGWGLNVFNPDRDWVKAKHDLNMIPPESPVKFRIALGTNGGQQIGNEGFAFDNVHILERSRVSVLEHFTNSADLSSMEADDVVDAFDAAFFSDVISLQYHTSFPGIDPMNMNNPDPASTRSGILGIGVVPYAVLNGGGDETRRYDFALPSRHPDSDELFRSSLEVPGFTVDLDVDWLTGHVEASATVTCRDNSIASNIQLYIAVIETEVLSYTGGNSDNRFRNVVLDMLPTPAGKLLGAEWYAGMEITTFNTWEYADYVEDVEDLALVAFIQDRSTDEILQAAVSYKDPNVGTDRSGISPLSVRVFPNPTKGELTVVTGLTDIGSRHILIFDLSGRIVYREVIPPGQEPVQLDLRHFDPGIYIFQLHDRSGILGIAKFSLIH